MLAYPISVKLAANQTNDLALIVSGCSGARAAQTAVSPQSLAPHLKSLAARDPN